MVLDSILVDRVRRLLKRGFTQRGACRALESAVSRGSIQAIANGKRRLVRAPDPDPLVDALDSDRRRIGRCKCGRLVSLPCLACRLERSGAGRPIAEAFEDELASEGLSLKPDDRRRYEEVRARRGAGQIDQEQ
jgi:hypothetical protein